MFMHKDPQLQLLHLQFQAHGLALLIKKLYKRVPELKEPWDAAIDISNFIGSHAWFRKLVHDKQKQSFGKILQICSRVRQIAQHKMLAWVQCNCIAATIWYLTCK